MENIISLNVKDLPYKKMKGFLKNHKINPDDVALKVEISSDFIRYTPLVNWQNYLQFSHKVVRIILLKTKNIFLFVGHSNDGKTIIYNPEFSKLILEFGFNPILLVKQLENDKPERTYILKSKITRLDMLLDIINRLGINSLSDDEKKELDYLSKNN
jgi:hypothetical protein